MTMANCDLCRKTEVHSFQPIEEHFFKMASNDELTPRTILCEEIARIQPSFDNLGIGFSISHAHRECRSGKSMKPPYFSCRYNARDMGNVNIVTSEEAKGNAWDKHRIFNVGNLGTTEVLLRSMAKTLREAVPQLVRLSPTLAEALTEIEGTIRRMDETRLPQLMAYHSPGKA
jgi:hypothetical protein